jgi:PhnB protein
MNLNPYLTFDGRCEEAMTFYAKVLAGKIEAMMNHEGTPMESHTPPEWRKKIMHARIRWDDHVLMASDAPPERYNKPQGFSVTINTGDTAEAERIFKELSEGGTVQMALQQTFWAKRFGAATDRFGTPWMINCE